MHSKLHFLIPLLGAMAITAIGATHAADPGFKSIFNGKDLTGWEGNPKLWSVQDGAITGRTGEDSDTKLKHNTFLIWRGGKVGDFELRFQYRIVKGNSGVQYRSKELPKGEFGPIVGGYQADFEAGKTYSGILYEERGRGILAKRGEKTVIKPGAKPEVTGSVGNTDEIQAAIKDEDWNDYRIVARGNHLQHFINGKQTIEVTDEDAEKGAKEGILALQIHVGPVMTVQFKGLQLKEFNQRSDLDLMQGEWAPVQIVGNGQMAPADSFSQVTLKVTGQNYEVSTAGGGDGGSFDLNTTQNPKAMDITTKDGKPGRAIYEISGDTMRVCYAMNDNPRPAEFAAPEGSNHILVVYRRK